MKISFIGCGSMGTAILSAVIAKGITTNQSLSVSDINVTQCHQIKHNFDVAIAQNNLDALDEADIIVLAIKPQNLPDIIFELNGKFKATQLIISIMAGVKIRTIAKELNHTAIVRVMPNLPTHIGKGISAWTTTVSLTHQQREQVLSILNAMGNEIYVDKEEYIDMATAISGSGPAYAFLMIESLIEAAQQIGLPADIAQELVKHTIMGSAEYALRSSKSPTELRQMVTSPSGTTEAALQQMENFPGMVSKAVYAAYNKARELET